MSMLIAVGLAASPALADDAPQAKGKDPNKVVCRKIAATGTRMGKRYCRTQQEWDEQAEAARRDFRTGETNGAKAENRTSVF